VHPISKKFLEISNVDTTELTLTPATLVNHNSPPENNMQCRCLLNRISLNCAAIWPQRKRRSHDPRSKKYFRKACFSTEQIRNLSGLFLTASGKYQFFDAAYPYVSDQDQYAALQTEINDSYYTDRFKGVDF
jgi:hypothetical protein